MKKKVAYWIGHYFGGAEKAILTIVENAGDLIEPYFIFFKEGPLTEYSRKNNIKYAIFPLSDEVYTLDKHNFFSLKKLLYILKLIYEIFFSGIKLSCYLKQNKIRVIHINNFKPAIITLIAKTIFNFKFIMHYHTDFSIKILNKILYIFADHIICNSYFVKQQCFNDICSPKISVSHIGIDLNKIILKKKEDVLKSFVGFPSKNKKIILAVGYYYMWKNYELLIEAISKLQSQNLDIIGIIAGDTKIGDKGYFEKLKKLVEKCGLEKQIFFIGYRKDIYDIINSSDIVVSCSEKEPYGMTILEALGLSKPVIASNEGGPKEIIVNNKNGFLIEKSNSKEMSDKILLLLNNTEMYSEFSENAKKHILNNFNVQQYLESIIKYY